MLCGTSMETYAIASALTFTFRSGHCYSCVPVASLHTSASSKATQVDQQASPVYDAYFSPLRDKNRYWFGAMLLVRGVLLVLLTVTLVDDPELNVFALFLFIAFFILILSIENVEESWFELWRRTVARCSTFHEG